MVGVIQKILLDMVLGEGGPESLAEVRRRTPLDSDRTFRLDTVYSDAECLRLFQVAQEVLQLSTLQTFEIYSDYFCKDAMQRWPTWWDMSKNAREFLSHQPTIHNCFATGVRDPEARKAVTDKFRVVQGTNEIVTHYRSPNKLCDLYKALGRWVLRHYGEDAEIAEPLCMHRGDSECEIHIRWSHTNEDSVAS